MGSACASISSIRSAASGFRRQGHSLRLVQQAGGWKVARMVTDHYGDLERSPPIPFPNGVP
jgi:hypothetical protein